MNAPRRDLLGDGVEIHIGIPFRQENQCCRREETPKRRDVETIDMMYRQHVEVHVETSWAIPYWRLLSSYQTTEVFQEE